MSSRCRTAGRWAQAEIERLRARATGPLAGAEDRRRQELRSGVVDEDDAVLKVLKRYEAESARRIKRFKALFAPHRREAFDPPPALEREPYRARDDEAYRRATAALTARAVLPTAEPRPIPECAAEPVVSGLKSPSYEPARFVPTAPAPGVAAGFASRRVEGLRRVRCADLPVFARWRGRPARRTLP